MKKITPLFKPLKKTKNKKKKKIKPNIDWQRNNTGQPDMADEDSEDYIDQEGLNND
jgi:hypothetical protein